MRNLRYFLFVLTVLSFFVEGTIISLPLVFALSVCCYLLFPDELTTIFIFLSAFIIDVLRMSQVGSTAAFLAILFIFINFYNRGFELKDERLIIAIVFISSLIYARIFAYSTNIFIYLLIFAGIGGILWLKSGPHSSKT